MLQVFKFCVITPLLKPARHLKDTFYNIFAYFITAILNVIHNKSFSWDRTVNNIMIPPLIVNDDDNESNANENNIYK